MKQYLNLLQHVMETGVDKNDRTGTGTRSVFGYQMRFDLNEGFPLVTTKKVFIKSVIHELLFFIAGETNNKYLTDKGVNIWTPWQREDGELGKIYGFVWRKWPNFVRRISQIGSMSKVEYVNEPIDQLSELIWNIKNNPDSRRHIITAWNPSFLPEEGKTHNENINNGKAVLPACHTLVQFDVTNNKLSCQLYQRSGDIFIGVPLNIASYALLTMMIAQVCDLELGEFIHTFGSAHIYNDHFEQVKTQLSRKPKPLPKMILNKNIDNIFDFSYDDFTLEGYDPHPVIKAPVAV